MGEGRKKDLKKRRRRRTREIRNASPFGFLNDESILRRWGKKAGEKEERKDKFGPSALCLPHAEGRKRGRDPFKRKKKEGEKRRKEKVLTPVLIYLGFFCSSPQRERRRGGREKLEEGRERGRGGHVVNFLPRRRDSSHGVP